ncbi:Zinc-binding dehydrogenase family protein (plasmid) [Rhizobium leguminosarum]|uniref:Zinc-binding dehydrogenase family protein n=1 Tax=Rhizobium leguminosarum TaxID=384 RepID=A0A2Z4YSF0_RHILE|nr:Zinc-binding dehydrogenase family protein [Rhizobium leguminosarum]
MIGRVSNASKVDAARAAGADHVIVDGGSNFADDAIRLTGGEGRSHRVYGSGPTTFAGSVAVLRRSGTFLLVRPGAGRSRADRSDESAKEHQDRFRGLPSNGSVNCIGSRPNCAAFILRLATPGDSNVCPADRQHAGIAHPSPCAYHDQSPLGEALAYIAKYWEGLKLFLTDGPIEIDNNRVERTIQPEVCPLCGARCWNRERGDHRLTHRNLLMPRAA